MEEQPFNLIPLKRLTTPNKGSLQFFEANREAPFDIKRIYYITETPANENRGMHAHKKLKQFLFCPYGKVKIIIDNGRRKSEYVLDRPDVGLLLFPCVWRDMVWLQDNSVLCVAVSDYYDESDYIRDYDEFLRYVEANG